MPLQQRQSDCPRATRLFRATALDPRSGERPDWDHPEIPAVVPETEANLIGSLTTHGTHMPVLDIDRINVRLVESSTPGNHHLYIDKEMGWDDYVSLLRELARVGILESGWVEACIKQGSTFVRKPGVTKQPPLATGRAYGQMYR